MITRRLLILSILAVLAGGCANDDDGFFVTSHLDDFNEGLHEWTIDFADYPADDSLNYELTFEHTVIPGDPVAEKALMVSGNNLNQDLFMFLKKKIRHLRANTEYAIAFDIKFATNIPPGPDEYNDYPGEKVYLKAGATVQEPVKIVSNGSYRMNIDKGDQHYGGSDMVVIGNISQSTEGVTGYFVEVRNNSSSFTATTDDRGELWIIVGTDSAYKGVTTLYYTEIALALSISE